MTDLVFVLATALAFALLVAFVAVCDRIIAADDPAIPTPPKAGTGS